MPDIRFDHATKEFATGVPAVRDVTLTVGEGELVVLVGPSGSGKTTLLRMVNRLIEPTSGHIYIGDREIHDIPATELRRHIGYVIQQAGLFPHMTVAQNVAVVPKLLGWQRATIRERTSELLQLVDLAPELYLDRYPRQLSGGQQQRVGIARAMAADPPVLLMDEPFGAIDAITRADLQQALLDIQRKVSKTIIFVTHDVEEALRLADRIAIMRTGEVIQYGAPLELLAHPADQFVETLLGARDVLRQMSLIPVSAVMQPARKSTGAATIAAGANLREALSTLIRDGAAEARVTGAGGETVGSITLEQLLREVTHPDNLAMVQS